MTEMWREPNSDKLDAFANTANELLGNIPTRKRIIFMLGLVCFFNLLLWGSSLLFPTEINLAFEKVRNVSNKLANVVLAFPFFLGMFTTYCIFRLRFPDIEEQELDNDVLASYNYQAHSQKRWLVWLFSIVGGVANLILIIIALLSLR